MSQAEFEAAIAGNKPYFGPFLGCRRSWPHIYWFQQKLMKKLADTHAASPFNILEIGSWAGASTYSWAEGLQRYFAGNGHIVAVDVWSDTATDAPDLVSASQAAKEMFQHNMRAGCVAHLVEALQATSDEAFEMLRPRRFELIYIDGDHAYEQVRRDIDNAQHLLMPNGIICGDDLEVQADAVDPDIVDQAIAGKLGWAEHPERDIGFHPGVTRAVFETFGRVSEWGGFWAVAKNRDGWESISLDGIDALLPLPLLQYGEDGQRLFAL